MKNPFHKTRKYSALGDSSFLPYFALMVTFIFGVSTFILSGDAGKVVAYLFK